MLYQGKNCETYSFTGATSDEVHKKLVKAVGDRNVVHSALTVVSSRVDDRYAIIAYVEQVPVGKQHLVEG